MKISYNWLKQYVATDLTPEAASHELTMLGLEVEGLEPWESLKGGLKGVVVGHVLSADQHPNADRLRVCKVDAGQGGEPLQIVCGAPNVAAGQKVPVALLGTTLYPSTGEPMTMKPAKIRGIESQGMICAEDELGLGASHDGILVLDGSLKPGTPLADVLGVQTDWVLEIGLTPNRTDAMSHYGVARDLAARLSQDLKPVSALSDTLNTSSAPACPVQVQLPRPEMCPRYSGIVITGVKVQDSPAWLQQRLAAIGQRSINNIVDVTNYILHELGQPLHAFDLAKITGNKIIVDTCPAGTPFVALDGKERKLLAEDLMINDPAGPLCMAGVMGGDDSGVSETTTSIFLESAWFAPDAIRNSSRRHNLFTETAYRFARGTDVSITMTALERATALILEVAGGSYTQPVDMYPVPVQNRTVVLDLAWLNAFAGQELEEGRVADILYRLDFFPDKTNEPGKWLLTVPHYRVDVYRPQDVAEEVMRVYGYDNIAPASKLAFTPAIYRDGNSYDLRATISNRLAAAGLRELRTNSLVGKPLSGIEGTVSLANPLSEEVYCMRTSLLHSGLEVLAWNLNRQAEDLHLFEFGKVYGQREGKYSERWVLGLYITGRQTGDHWTGKPAPASIYSLKQRAEQLMAWLGIQDASFGELEGGDVWLDYGLVIQQKKKVLGRLGRVRTAESKKYDIQQPVFYAELEWDMFADIRPAKAPEFAELPKFPAVRRDLSMLVPDGVSFGQLAETIRKANPGLIQDVNLFDIYKQANGPRSYALSITLLDKQKTLTDEAVDKTMQRVQQQLEQISGLEIRKG